MEGEAKTGAAVPKVTKKAAGAPASGKARKNLTPPNGAPAVLAGAAPADGPNGGAVERAEPVAGTSQALAPEAAAATAGEAAPAKPKVRKTTTKGGAARKEFKPKIPAGRRPKSAAGGKGKVAADGRGRGGRGRGRGDKAGRGGRRKRVYDQSQMGIFSTGFGGKQPTLVKEKKPPAAAGAAGKFRAGGGAKGRASGGGSSKGSAAVKVEPDHDNDSREPEADDQWFLDMALKERPMFVPLSHNKIPASASRDAPVPKSGAIKSEPGTMDTAVPTTDIVEDELGGRLVFLQLPDALPACKNDLLSSEAAKIAAGDMSSVAETEPDLLTDETFFNTIKQLGDGAIGKLRRRRSGALELQLGDNTLTLSSGTPVNFLQELFAINDKDDPTEMVNVGFVNEKYTASPSVAHLLRDMNLKGGGGSQSAAQ